MDMDRVISIITVHIIISVRIIEKHRDAKNDTKRIVVDKGPVVQRENAALAVRMSGVQFPSGPLLIKFRVGG